METITKELVASVGLVTSKLSEDEIALYQMAINYALESLDDAAIEQRFGASRDELEGARDDLRHALADLHQMEPQPVG